ncbi:FUN14 domain containing protein [Gracilaria domingensis]|nr:FUN14 domain containing protein [Gracilaria domingensis]
MVVPKCRKEVRLFSKRIQRVCTKIESLCLQDMPSTTFKVTIAAGTGSFAAADDSAREESENGAQQATLPELDPLDLSSGRKPVVQSLGEQLSFGAVLGFATGYSIRKVGTLVLFLVGTEVVVLQYMAYRQWLVIDWRRLGRNMSPKFDRSAWDGLTNVLLYKMQFSAAFSGGLVAGLRLSYQN